MNATRTGGRWLEVQKRSKLVGRPDGSMKRLELPSWYGRLKVNGRWKWYKLFTDRRASQQRWSEIIREQELRASGVVTPLMEQATRPLAEHFAEYLADLKRRTSVDHYRITENMLSRLVNGAGWTTLTEIDEASTQKILTTLQAENDYTVRPRQSVCEEDEGVSALVRAGSPAVQSVA
jgi:hypothetical protein